MNTCTYDQIRKFVRQGDPLRYIQESENENYTIHWTAGTGEVPSSEGYYIIIRVAINIDSLADTLELDFAYYDGLDWWLSTHRTGQWANKAIPLAYVEDTEDEIVYEGLDD